MMKICTSCNLEKTIDNFTKKKTSKDGLEYRCKVCRSNSFKNYYNSNKEIVITRIVNNHKLDRKQHRKTVSNWYYKNKKHKQAYEKKKRSEDINFRLSGILRRRLRSALKQNTKSGSAIRNLGCTLTQFKTYIESLWQPGMTWANYGPKGWHIDHIKPLSSFVLTDETQLKEACNFRNLQPLWAEDNLSKGNKLEYNNTDVKST